MAGDEDYKRLGTELSASAEQRSGSLKAELTKSLSSVFDSDGKVITNEAGDPEDPISYTLFKVIDKQRAHIEMVRKDSSMTKLYVSHSVGIDGDELRTKMDKIVDWTANQGDINIHTGNYVNTTYSVGDGGLSQNNFTNTLKSKLDGIASSANNYSISSDLLDEDNMSTNSATKVPSQQSVKAYVADGLALKLDLTGGTMTGLIRERFLAITSINKFTVDVRTTSILQILIKTGNFTLATATPSFAGQELTIIALTAGVIRHSAKPQAGNFVFANGSHLAVSAGQAYKFVTDVNKIWRQIH